MFDFYSRLKNMVVGIKMYLSHGTPHREWLHEYTPLTKTHAMYMGDGRIQQVVGVGTIIIHLYSGHEINV
jgi:hypothetical protein